MKDSSLRSSGDLTAPQLRWLEDALGGTNPPLRLLQQPGVWQCLAKPLEGTAQMRRWIAFNIVGALGILVQVSTLAALTGWLDLHYLVGTGLAVEAAVLHNFVWHELWTWADRFAHDKGGMWKRLVRFHLSNGALSIGGNLILMRLFVESWSMNCSLANIATIAICSFLNFLASDRFVFERESHQAQKIQP